MSFRYSGKRFHPLAPTRPKSYKNCVGAGPEYTEIVREIKSLNGVLKPLRDEVQKSDSSLFSQDQASASEMVAAMDGFKHILEDVQTILAKYEGHVKRWRGCEYYEEVMALVSIQHQD